MHRQIHKSLVAAAACVALAAAFLPSGAPAASTGGPRPISDDKLSARTTVVDGGAKVLASTRTVAHSNGHTVDPHDGVNYSYNMVGANPNTCTGTACDVTVQVDITPVVVN